jgi:hypothetical protein
MIEMEHRIGCLRTIGEVYRSIEARATEINMQGLTEYADICHSSINHLSAYKDITAEEFINYYNDLIRHWDERRVSYRDKIRQVLEDLMEEEG